MKFARLLARLAIGGMFIGHGTQKWFGWFGGPGIEGTTGMMGKLGLAPAKANAHAAAASETLGGLGIALGAFTPAAGAALIATMITAIRTVHWDKGFWTPGRRLRVQPDDHRGAAPDRRQRPRPGLLRRRCSAPRSPARESPSRPSPPARSARPSASPPPKRRTRRRSTRPPRRASRPTPTSPPPNARGSAASRRSAPGPCSGRRRRRAAAGRTRSPAGSPGRPRARPRGRPGGAPCRSRPRPRRR